MAVCGPATVRSYLARSGSVCAGYQPRAALLRPSQPWMCRATKQRITGRRHCPRPGFCIGCSATSRRTPVPMQLRWRNLTSGVQLLTTDAKALYVSGADGRDYLVWQRAGTLVAQEFDAGALQLTGEIRNLADRVATSGAGLMNAAVSGKFLLYSDTSPVSQFTWFDRSGKRL